jgi:hypothetical protein
VIFVDDDSADATTERVREFGRRDRRVRCRRRSRCGPENCHTSSGSGLQGESKLDLLVAWEYMMLIADKLIGHIVLVRLRFSP